MAENQPYLMFIMTNSQLINITAADAVRKAEYGV
jgi:hypothetical protein